MAATTLGTPLSDEAVRSVNFFNGRLLTGSDLSREQEARRLAERRIGSAIGPGIAWGLEVGIADATGATATISTGLAISPSGLVLHLATSPVVHLVAPPPDARASVVSGFGPCRDVGGAPYVAGDGLFLLTLAPIAIAEGKAPVLALDAVNTRCSTDAFVDALQFRLVRLDGFTATGTSELAVSLLRSDVARGFFAADRLEAMLDHGLSRCEVALAVVYLDDGVIRFIDMWSVRRRLAHGPASAVWAGSFGERGVARAEAQVAQLHDQIDAMSTALANRPAVETLHWLPPAGFLPRTWSESRWRTFLGARAPEREVPLAPAAAAGVLADALQADGVDLGGPAAESRYRVYRLAGAGPLLIARDRPNHGIAEQVWLDGARAGIPGASDVQSGFDRLRAGTCMHVALRPGIDVEATLGRLVAGADVTICFEPGRYATRGNAPFRIAKLGKVSVQGHGAVLENAKGECALRIESCEEVSVGGMAFEAGTAAAGTGLQGALTVLDTPRIRIESVRARCAAAQTLNCCAVVAGNRKKESTRETHVVVTGCELEVGSGQQGLLVLNADLAIVGDNLVAGVGKDAFVLRGIVVAGSRAGLVRIHGNVVRDVINGIGVAVSEATEGPDTALRVERAVIEGNRVDLKLAGQIKRGRPGIFIGNVRSASVRNNHVRLAAGDRNEFEPVGIHMAGEYGPSLAVRDNLVQECFEGIVFQPKNPPEAMHWMFRDNVLQGGTDFVLHVVGFNADRLAASDNVEIR